MVGHVRIGSPRRSWVEEGRDGWTDRRGCRIGSIHGAFWAWVWVWFKWLLISLLVGWLVFNISVKPSGF